MLSELTGEAGYAQLLQPRRGHLLEVAPPQGMAPLKHGMMEMAYSKVGRMIYTILCDV